MSAQKIIVPDIGDFKDVEIIEVLVKEGQNIKKNDLIFWRGHVAIILSKNKLIHAYGPSKKVLIMNINYAIKKIEKTANLKVVGIRRIN